MTNEARRNTMRKKEVNDSLRGLNENDVRRILSAINSKRDYTYRTTRAIRAVKYNRRCVSIGRNSECITNVYRIMYQQELNDVECVKAVFDKYSNRTD